jgi:hypothetical protein
VQWNMFYIGSWLNHLNMIPQFNHKFLTLISKPTEVSIILSSTYMVAHKFLVISCYDNMIFDICTYIIHNSWYCLSIFSLSTSLYFKNWIFSILCSNMYQILNIFSTSFTHWYVQKTIHAHIDLDVLIIWCSISGYQGVLGS